MKDIHKEKIGFLWYAVQLYSLGTDCKFFQTNEWYNDHLK